MQQQDSATPQHSSESNRKANVVAERSWAAVLLAWVAAFSDAIGYLLLQQLGASFVTGNSMATGAALGRLDWPEVIQRGLPILIFFLGNMLGFLVLHFARHRGAHSPFALVFGLEAAFLLAFLLIGSHALRNGIIPSTISGIFYLCVVLLTLAMGLQTSTIKRTGKESVRTTFVTSAVSEWAEAMIQYLAWLQQQASAGQLRRALSESRQQSSFHYFELQAGIWCAYVVGAICGSALELHLELSALIFPLGALALLIVVDIVRPFEEGA